MVESFRTFQHVGMALDPIHVGTGGARLGRVDLTIVRDPVTRVPKIPGSSLAGVYRAYAAMAQQARSPVANSMDSLSPTTPIAQDKVNLTRLGRVDTAARPTVPSARCSALRAGPEAGSPASLPSATPTCSSSPWRREKGQFG
jgi:hypothetical protein